MVRSEGGDLSAVEMMRYVHKRIGDYLAVVLGMDCKNANSMGDICKLGNRSC